MQDFRREAYDKLKEEVLVELGAALDLGDAALTSTIDRVLDHAASGGSMSLRDRLELRDRLFNSFRRLDVLQELLDEKVLPR